MSDSVESEQAFWELNIKNEALSADIDPSGTVGCATLHLLGEKIERLRAEIRQLRLPRPYSGSTLAKMEADIRIDTFKEAAKILDDHPYCTDQYKLATAIRAKAKEVRGE